MKNPKKVIAQSESAPYNLKLKRSGPLNFYLGCGFKCDRTDTLCMVPGKYIDQMEEVYAQQFGTKSVQKHRPPLQKGDHPEIDKTPFLSEEDTEVYQSPVVSSQWNISIGRFDIQSAIMTMSKFCTPPRRSHLERMKQVYGYLCKYQHNKIRFCVPDYLNVPTSSDHDW